VAAIRDRPRSRQGFPIYDPIFDDGRRSFTLTDAILGPVGSTPVTGNVIYLGTDDDGDPLTVIRDDSLASQPQHGSVTISPAGDLTYVPDPGNQVWGTDRVGFRFSDGYDLSNVAYLTIRQSLGDPVLRSDSFQVSRGETLRIPVSSLVGNDSFGGGQVADLWVQSIRLHGLPDNSASFTRASNGTAIIPFSDLDRVDHSQVSSGDVIEVHFASFVAPGVYDFSYDPLYPGPD
jgi:Bacterial Ig domain